MVDVALKKIKKFTVADFMTDEDLNSQAMRLEFSDEPIKNDMEARQLYV